MSTLSLFFLCLARDQGTGFFSFYSIGLFQPSFAMRIKRERRKKHYLRTVRVTAAVYRGFHSKLKTLLLFTFQHRAGVRLYTSSPLKALTLRRPVVHQRLSDFVALWSYIQRATPRERAKKNMYIFFSCGSERLSSGSSLQDDSGTLTRSAPSALPTHFFSGPGC
ncbi:hypothetical protein Mapa_003854 [Marchantia paleacea]|nr:hypothetical protein Mapa_003854 [Marchantia paleacea]